MGLLYILVVLVELVSHMTGFVCFLNIIFAAVVVEVVCESTSISLSVSFPYSGVQEKMGQTLVVMYGCAPNLCVCVCEKLNHVLSFLL